MSGNMSPHPIKEEGIPGLSQASGGPSDGYDLFLNGEWHERYALKREAVEAAEAMGANVTCEHFAA